jgi:hypothetical protein
MQTVYLDLETTDLHPSEDEIVEIGILDDQGQPLLDTLVRPIRHTSWPEAEYINGISPFRRCGFSASPIRSPIPDHRGRHRHKGRYLQRRFRQRIPCLGVTDCRGNRIRDAGVRRGLWRVEPLLRRLALATTLRRRRPRWLRMARLQSSCDPRLCSHESSLAVHQ